jgi:hypothetical protein
LFGILGLPLDHRNDALQVVDCGELDDDPALGPSQSDLNPSLEVV